MPRVDSCDLEIKALVDESDDVRVAAARALGKIGDPSVVEPLCLYYSSRQAAVEKEAGEESLVLICGDGSLEEIAKLKDSLNFPEAMQRLYQMSVSPRPVTPESSSSGVDETAEFIVEPPTPDPGTYRMDQEEGTPDRADDEIQWQ